MAKLVGDLRRSRRQGAGGNHHVQRVGGLAGAEQLVAYVGMPRSCLGVPRKLGAASEMTGDPV